MHVTLFMWELIHSFIKTCRQKNGKFNSIQANKQMNYCDTDGQSGSKTIMFTVFGLLLDNVQLLNIEIKSQQSHFKPLNWRKLQSVLVKCST